MGKDKLYEKIKNEIEKDIAILEDENDGSEFYIGKISGYEDALIIINKYFEEV